jgi:hypothetical protein
MPRTIAPATAPTITETVPVISAAMVWMRAARSARMRCQLEASFPPIQNAKIVPASGTQRETRPKASNRSNVPVTEEGIPIFPRRSMSSNSALDSKPPEQPLDRWVRQKRDGYREQQNYLVAQ